MAIDGLFFKCLTALCKKEIKDYKISKIYNLSNSCYIFNLWKNGNSKNFIISATPGQAYFNLQNIDTLSYGEVTHFTNLLRFHLTNSTIIDLSTINNDRILKITIQTHDEIYETVNYSLYFEATGKFTNLIFCKADDIIIDAVQRLSSSNKNERLILPGFKYTWPALTLKHPISDLNDQILEFSNYYYGISLLLESEIRFRMQTLNQSFAETIKLIEQSSNIYFTKSNEKLEFHFIPLLHLSNNYRILKWNEGLEEYFLDKTLEENRRIQNRELVNVTKLHLERNRKKLIKLNNDNLSIEKIDKLKYYGDLLFTYNEFGLVKGDEVIINIEDEVINIPINNQISLIENGKLYFKKYRKYRNGAPIINEQIKKTEDEILYFESLLSTIEYSDLNSLKEIHEELQMRGYLKKSIKKEKKKTAKNYLPKTFFTEAKIKISVGLNHLQNDYLTFNLAKHYETFFHVKDYPGSHVIVHSQELDETTIRMAANLAAFYSKARHSSSVPVDYTLVKNVKKHPSNNPGLVIIRNHKTIYIDPWDPNK